MILIQSESNGGIWHGHIQSVDFINKTVDKTRQDKTKTLFKHDNC